MYIYKHINSHWKIPTKKWACSRLCVCVYVYTYLVFTHMCIPPCKRLYILYSRGVIYICVSIIYVCVNTRYVYRVATTNTMPYLYRSFSAKEPYYSWLICGK